jgi:hypothetical protein
MAVKKLDNKFLNIVADLQKRFKKSIKIAAMQSTTFAKVQCLT